MTDDDKKKTACLFITSPDRVQINAERYELAEKNAKTFLDKFGGYCVVPTDNTQNFQYGVQDFCMAANGRGLDNVQVIFDIHGDEHSIALSSEDLAVAMKELFCTLKAKNLEILFANCKGSSNVILQSGEKKSINEMIKDFNKVAPYTYGGSKNVSSYYMPKGHDANITFTKNGDIFFISSDAERAVSKQDDLKDVFTETFYKTKDQKDHEDDLQIVHKGGCWHVPTKGGNTKVLEGIYKNKPSRKYDINVNPNKEVPTELVPYEPSLASKIKNEPDLNLNKENEINTTIKK